MKTNIIKRIYWHLLIIAIFYIVIGTGTINAVTPMQIMTVNSSNNCITNLSARAKQNKIQLTWTDSSNSAYHIFRTTEDDSTTFTEIATRSSSYSTYLDTDIETGKKYWYKLIGDKECEDPVIVSVISDRRVRNNKYFLTVTSSGNGTVSGSDSLIAGIPHTITAKADPGYYFKGWELTTGNATIADSMADSTTITLDSSDATVMGMFGKVIVFIRESYEEVEGYCIQQTADGGYIILGLAINDRKYFYLFKYTSTGNFIWNKRYEGPDFGNAFEVEQIADGGYIIVGATAEDNSDVMLLKTTATGEIIWVKTYGGEREDCGYSIQQTRDGGFIIAGYTSSFGMGLKDVYLIKTDKDGNSMWTKTIGGTANDLGQSVQQTSDGGFIIVGYTIPLRSRDPNSYLIKTTINGDTLWTKTYGNSVAKSVQQTSDGGFIVAGYTSFSGIMPPQACLIKTDSNGNIIWNKKYARGSDKVKSYANSVQQTRDGGYISAGTIDDDIIFRPYYSFDPDEFYPDNRIFDQIYIIKTSSNGDVLWTKTYGDKGRECGYSVQQTTDGGYIISGSSARLSYHSFELPNLYFIKTDENGNINKK